ncbi:MAG TPA: D-glucuronyl C5-epimerase family protein [Gaiellaceae bacterium]|nr:D-glucuronyl C5-epimerase family protein [Gaiellaceae bacterium]
MTVVRGFTTSLAIVAAALVLAGGAPATPPVPGEAQAFAAVKHSRLGPTDKAAYRGEIARAAHLARTLPGGRWQHVVSALEQFSAFQKKLTKQRALILFGQLKANDDYFAHHFAPKDKYDFVGDDGIVYRYFAGHSFEFHPLANFGRLNALVAANNADGAQQLADALIARGVYQHGGGVGFEYEFSFGGGHPPWLSGMAQAVAAQAFAGAASLVPDEAGAYMREAHAAYVVVPRLLVKVAAGPWIRLYAFSSLPVFNAQLQTVLSLNAYASAAKNSAASSLAARMQTSAAEMIGRFDTGYWTYYSLAHDPSPLDYQQFVVQLLHKLAPLDQRFAAAAQRIGQYQSQPPAFQVANSAVGTMKFWLSKPSTVHIVSAAGPEKSLSLVGGWHTIAWKLPKHPGFYPIAVSATDWAGNNASFQPLPIVHASSAGTKSNARRKSDAGAAAVPALSIGAGIDDPSGLDAAKSLGLRVVRMNLTWPTDATTPDPGVVAMLQSVPGVILELQVNPLPADPTALAQYAASLAQQLPSLRDLILAPAPSAATAAAYAGAFATVRSAVQAVAPIPVGVAIDGSAAPKSTVSALGRSLGADVPDVVAFRPAPVAATNQWTATQTTPLVTALQAAFGAVPPVIVDGLAEPTSATQGAQYVAAINAAACSTNVQAVIVDRLVDSVDGSATTGLYESDGTAKPAAALVKAAAGPAQRGIVVCPGLAVDAAATSITYPTALDPATAASVTFGCARDCLYLVSLVDASGKPVVARRGSLKGGAAPAVVGLPKAALGAGSYTIDVRLVNAVNPGQVAQLTSPVLSVG